MGLRTNEVGRAQFAMVWVDLGSSVHGRRQSLHALVSLSLSVTLSLSLSLSRSLSLLSLSVYLSLSLTLSVSHLSPMSGLARSGLPLRVS